MMTRTTKKKQRWPWWSKLLILALILLVIYDGFMEHGWLVALLIIAWLAVAFWPLLVLGAAVVLAIVVVRKRPRARKWLLVGGVAIASVMALGYLVHDASEFDHTYKQIASSRHAAEKTAEQRLSEMRKSLQSTGLISSHMATSKVDVCYISSADAGFSTLTWYQRCYLRYVDGYYTDASTSDILAKTGALSGSFGKAQSDDWRSSFPCDMFEADDNETLRFRPAGVNGQELWCDVPDPAQGASGYNMYEDKYTIKTFRSFDRAKIDNSKNQIWVIWQTESYYDEDLGCGVGIFCPSPRSTPIQAG